MPGFFRKVASAFVELPEERRAEPEPSAEDVDALLARVAAESTPQPEPEPAPAPQAPTVDLLRFDVEAVCMAAGIEEGPNSAGRLLKMIAGLAMFPPDQQLAMVRALDAADASWTEGGVLADARKRQSVLRAHQDKVERDHARRVAEVADRARDTQATGDAQLADIDRQLAELQRQRQEVLSTTATGLAQLDGERRDLDAALTNVRTEMAAAQKRLSDLINFFAGQGPPPATGG